jgi:hypothetical protein
MSRLGREAQIIARLRSDARLLDIEAFIYMSGLPDERPAKDLSAICWTSA